MAAAKTDFSTSEGRDRIIQRVNSQYPDFNKRRNRLIWVCRDMIRRVETSGDDGHVFFGVRLHQAGGLALSLGFGYPPIQVMTYLAHKNRVRILPEFGSLCVPPQWDDLKRRRPDIDVAIIYRVYDPGFPSDGHYRDLDIAWAGHKGEEKETPLIPDGPTETEIVENRNRIVQRLELWISDVEGKQESSVPAQHGKKDDPRTSKDKSEPEGGDDGLPLAVSKAYWAYMTAEEELGGDCTDKEAHDYITGDDPKGSFTHYTPRSLVTWTRQVRIGRNHHGTQKNKPRGGRSGRSTVSARDRDMPRNDA